MEEHQSRDTILAELDNLLDSRIGRLYGSQLALEDVWKVLEGNAKELNTIEARVNDSIQAILEIGSIRSSQREILLSDLQRRLHNFLASSVTFDDQTSAHIKRFYRRGNFKELGQRYIEHRKSLFDKEAIRGLARVLRNVALHYSLPEILISNSITPLPGNSINDPGTEHRVTFLLDCEHAAILIKRSQISSSEEQIRALGCLEGYPDGLPISALTDNFVVVGSDIRDWLSKNEFPLVESEIEVFVRRYNEVVERYNEFQR